MIGFQLFERTKAPFENAAAGLFLSLRSSGDDSVRRPALAGSGGRPVITGGLNNFAIAGLFLERHFVKREIVYSPFVLRGSVQGAGNDDAQ